MGRLTKYDVNRNIWIDYNECQDGSREAMRKLAHYEDLEEQGKLIELVVAEWRPAGYSLKGDRAYECTNCGRYVANIDDHFLKYCPHCGAKMEGEENYSNKNNNRFDRFN